MAKGNESTTKFKADISELKSAFQEAQRQVRLANSEFKAATAGMDKWSDSADGISAKLSQLNKVLDGENKKLKSLENQYALVAKEQGENSKGALELAIKINNQKSVIGNVEKQIKKYNSALDDIDKESKDADKSSDQLATGIDDVADSAKKAEKETSSFASSLGGALKKGFVGIAATAAGAVTGFLASGEATQEFTEDMGKLEAGFVSSGHSAETAKKSYQGMVGILGETDQSVEAVNHLAKLTDNEKELAEWTDIAAGIYGTFGDSLPIEGLTEAANETAKVGEVTGPLADALNWAGISEDEFNKKLAACADEQERSTLITQTLSETYQDAADIYKETNADLIAARQSTSDMNSAMAEMGKIAMPITTAIKNGFTSLISAMIPGLKEVGAGITGLFNVTKGAAEQLEGGLQSVFDGLLGKITSVLPKVLQIGLQIITSLVQGIINALPQAVDTLIGIIPQITQALLSLLPQLVTVGAQLITSIVTGLGQMIPQIVMQVITIVPQIIDALVNAIPSLIQGAVQFFMAIIDALPQVIQALLTALPQIVDTVINGLVTGIPLLVQGAVQLLNAIVDAIPKIIPLVIAALPQLITSLIDGLLSSITAIMQGAITLLMAIVEAIPKIIPPLIQAIPQIIQALLQALIDYFPTFLAGAVEYYGALIKAIPKIIIGLYKAVPAIVSAILQALAGLPKQLFTLFLSAWESIKSVFAAVKDWFSEKFQSAWNAIKTIWQNPRIFFLSLWNYIKSIFIVVKDWFGEQFGEAWKKIKESFKPAKQFFSTVWNDIKNVFSNVTSWFRDKFTSAANAVKEAFGNVADFFGELWSTIKGKVTDLATGISDTIGGAIKSGINGIISYVETTLNKIPEVVNGAIKLINELPGINIGWRMSNFDLPRLAKGGIIDKATTAVIGEDGKEAVVPLERNTRWLDIIANKLADELDMMRLKINNQVAPSVVNNFYQTNNSPKSLSRLEIYRQSKNLLNMKGV